MLVAAFYKLKEKIRFSIRLTVVAVFVLATSLTAIIAISLQYYFSEKMALEASVKHFNLTTDSVAGYLTRINEKSENTLSVMIQNSTLVTSNKIDKSELRNVMGEIMQLNPQFYAMYVGYENGDFYELINLESSNIVRQQLQAIEADRWVVIHIAGEGEARTHQTHYLDEQFNLRISQSKATNYDPRERIWFKNANSTHVSKTKPYFFTHLQAPGQTYSIKSADQKSVLALDVSLSSISEYLARQQKKISNKYLTELYIYNKEGEIIASNQQKNNLQLPTLTQLTLSEYQQAVLNKYPYLTVSNETNWPPLDFSVGGTPKGYSIDYINGIAEMLGLKVTYINGYAWSEFLQQFANNEIDIIQPIFKTPTNEPLGLMSEPITTLPFSIITKEGELPILTMKQLAGMKLAIGEGWSVIEVIKKHFPDIEIIELASTKAVLDAVSQGKVFAGLDNEAVFKYTQKQFFIKGIQYNQLDAFSHDLLPDTLHLLFHPEDAELKGLIDLAIKRLPTEYLTALQNKWLSNELHVTSKVVGTVPYPELLTLLEQSDQFSKLRLMTLNGIEKYVYITPLSANNEDGDFLAIAVPKEGVLSSTHEKIKLSTLITAACLIMVLPVSWFFASPIVGPIKTLEGENLKIKKRQFDQVSTLKSNIKEIHNLASSMVEMSQSIQQHEQNQKALMESFIELIAQAIDDKSPYTAGHCERVPELGIMLAKAASSSNEQAFKDFEFKNDDEFREFSLAAWLHDCGKITTPEHIVDKGTKLETIYNRIHEIRTRFEVLWRDAEIDYLQAACQAPEKEGGLKLQLKEKQSQLRKDFSFIASCNVGGEFMDEASLERLEKLSNITWQRYFDDKIGLSPVEEIRHSNADEQLPATEKLLSDKAEHLIPHDKPIEYDERLGIKVTIPEYKYNLGELYNLKITRGTLTTEDRFKINEHIISTIRMLDNVPFPDELARVPRYASTHHETLIGTGYPRKLTADNLSIPERVLVLADIFEALTAADRPYKKAKPLSVAIDILAKMVDEQHVDRDVFTLFLRSGIYLSYAKRYLNPAQIDEVDLTKYL
ncbi:HD domain-containing phosphohydrolase [Pseudoalteromonas sp. L1]|uniref:HD domain-containing phosphohydrolase n=1 Tax=Pseudoalteromonas sp. L1 TaxID=195716 RepID=UPI001F1EDEED|nr:transporter substrate-binding domain-containing protein [Pseudoalteromonas sp. L1]